MEAIPEDNLFLFGQWTWSKRGGGVSWPFERFPTRNRLSLWMVLPTELSCLVYLALSSCVEFEVVKSCPSHDMNYSRGRGVMKGLPWDNANTRLTGASSRQAPTFAGGTGNFPLRQY